MRFIDFRRIRFPAGWLQKAEQAKTYVENLPPDKRIKEINKRARIWHELKKPLEECSHSKCWYCESIQERSDNAVDHFRPKGRVAESPSHEGYWWLAFSWENYRFSCTYCNSRRKDQTSGSAGGKQDHFPLLDENTRAHSDHDDYDEEQICLLDPTKATDPGLLWFNQDGQAVPRYAQQTHPRLHLRAEVSIELYHLNYYKTKTQRQLLYNDIAQLVKDGDKYFDRFAAGDKTVEHALNRVMERLIRMLSEQAEFSAAARVYLRGFQSNKREWLAQILVTS